MRVGAWPTFQTCFLPRTDQHGGSTVARFAMAALVDAAMSGDGETSIAPRTAISTLRQSRAQRTKTRGGENFARAGTRASFRS